MLSAWCAVEVLKKLTVSNLAVVEKAEAEFAPGLNVLTGETGAGKSVLMGALELVLGGRADASVVRDGAKEAEVEADFGETTVRRTVTHEGRSRAWVNDESVSIAELRELGRSLVDIHGPTANQKLMEEAFQRETLDSYADSNFVKKGKAIRESGESVKRRYDSAFSELSTLNSQLSTLNSQLSTSLRSKGEFFAQRVDQLSDALASALTIAQSNAERRLERVRPRLMPALRLSLQRAESRLENAKAKLTAYSPYGVLDRGYSLTTTADGSVVKDAKNLKAGDVLMTRLAKGSVESVVR